ncbi:MAG TPA: hypothetical protein DCQ96_12275, partial [Verrucomicrobiales bacterium]|nr:hypothetical protein [Verrucomicrobiales bacterium]
EGEFLIVCDAVALSPKSWPRIQLLAKSWTGFRELTETYAEGHERQNSCGAHGLMVFYYG